MRRTGFTRRVLAMILVIIMTLQLVPANVFAFGELRAVDTSIKVDTLNKEDAINWPIKIYDYLNDGMLFEWNDSTHSAALTTGHTSGDTSTAPYGGGEAPPVTELGSDFTYAASSNYTASTTAGNSPYTYASQGTGYAVSLTKKQAVDFETPYYLRITDNANYSGSGGNHNMLLNYFTTDKSTSGDIRYMVMAYRANKVEDYYFSISLTDSTSGSGIWDRNQVTLPDSSDWTYVVYDLGSLCSSSIIQYVWLTWHTTTSWNTSYKGMNSGAYVDLTHVGYFSDLTEAHNYGQDCVAFDKNPGEYLRKSASFTATTTTVSPSARLDYIFSLYWNWKNAGDLPEMGDADSTNVYYGMDFTTTSKDNGAYTNAYTTNSYWTWETGATQYYKYTQNGVTGTNTFLMDAISVEQKSEGNGAMYVRLTNEGPSRILLSKFREDLAGQIEISTPTTSEVNYAVLVYRPNGLEAADKYAFWAQGYDASTANWDANTASNWKYAGLVSDTSNWASASNVNPQSFGTESGWQYVVVPLSETIGAKDSDMSQVTRLARAGLYLPELSNGKSLDLAYAVYFDSQTAADTFGAAAVGYMNSEPTITTSTTTKSWGTSRVWNAGNNKGFGMLYSTGGGNWPSTNKTAGGSNTTDAYGYDTWMLGYNTAMLSSSVYNTNRKDPMTGEKYTANYTPAAADSDGNYTVLKNVTGTTNNIYFINSYGSSDDGNTENGNAFDTSVLDFDGYELLETIKADGVLTVGLLEGSLRTVNVDGTDYRVPVYRQETVEYIAYLLVNALRIPQRDANGNYNMNYISGSESTQFGGVDLNGDGSVGWIDLDGDPRNGNETNEESVDLATALRHCLGITLSLNSSVGILKNSYEDTLGTYAETLKKDELLIGKFSDCRYSIDTAMDAAYYMLNSLFIANSFNQKQDDYYYLQMPSATLEMDDRTGTAYVFDAGFTTGITAEDGTAITDDGTNKSAISYSPVINADGTAGTGTIYMNNVTGKTQFNFSKSGTAYTTRFPFLPVTGSTGDYEGGTYSYSYWDDAQREYHTGSNSYYQANADASNFTSNRRNYNYVIASNGEFVYNKSDALFFDFEGDDDVYLFINGELVMDNGAAHSITGVTIDVNDYVDKAREVMAELAKYGYTNDMPIAEFDDMISASTLEEYIYDSTTGKITGVKTVTNPYTADQIASFKRWARLDLVDGEICKFDFYYMERHGWGANMRIVTNMHITDPALDVEKTAYQYGQEVEYGGVIDPTASLEYNFSLTNSGNQKLYNLTFTDDVIGVTLDPTNGLTVADGKNGIYVLDGLGKSLEAKDLSAVVTGYNATGQYVEVSVTFPEVDGDGGQTALKNFLNSLNAEGTESGYDDAEVTRAGSGLWVDGTVTIKGIHYMLTPEQTEAGTVHNTVYLTATTRINPDTVGSQKLYSDADHIIYTSGFPVHYQWAGHNIFMKMGHLLTEAKEEAATAGTQLNLYNKFFSSVDDLGDIYYNLCDKYGRTGGYYPYHTNFTDTADNEGYLINYDEPGIYTFYLLLYMQSGASKNYAPTGVDAEDIDDGEYAIVRSQVYVADVEDSVYVLDYGLSTETLDLDGELFKNDYLFGPYGTIRAKLMGATGTEPTYLDPATTSDTDYCRIAFQSQNLSAANTITTPDGIYKVNLAIPEEGKLIGYDSATGEYTLTGVGTVTINAVVPTDGNWDTPYLYYWYDDSNTGPAWPGTPMKSNGAGQFEIDIPADVTNVIINNGSGALQTNDLKITPGLESTIRVTVSGDNNVSASIETIIEEVTLHAKAPESWEKVYVHYWYDDGSGTTFPGEEMTETDGNGYYTYNIPGNVTNLIISNGEHEQSGDQVIYAGKEVWIEVIDNVVSSVTGEEDGITTNYYETSIKYTLSEGYVVHASVPNSWNDTIYIYYWHEGMTDDEMTWPGKPMTKGEFGWYTYDGLVPADVHQIIINDGNENTTNHQTVDLAITPGLETWIMVNNATVDVNNVQKYTAKVAYGSESSSTGLTFTPRDFMDQTNDMWLAITVHSTSFNPSVLNTTIDIHNETQMFKKISIIPATVVYYEDTFGAIEYNDEDANSANSFTHHGNGSGQLSQSIDPDQPYGQDSAYQGAENHLYSGDSMTEIEIMDKSVVGIFDFKGTGFEIIGRTNAFDSASVMARVYKKDAYTATAYDEYMAKAEQYVVDLGIYNNVFTTFDAAFAAWEKARDKYAAAVGAYNALVAAYEAADGYEEALIVAQDAFDAYAKACTAYKTAAADYELALQTYKNDTSDLSVVVKFGSCSYTTSEEMADPATLFTIGDEPTSPIQPAKFADMVAPTLPESPFVTVSVVYTQFDHGNDGGAEEIYQVPVIRVTGLELGEYVVELAGMPTYIFDENNSYEVIGTQPTDLYIDGVRIYQPMGAEHEAYTDKENNASVNEIRDLVAEGMIGIGILDENGLSVSSGTTTWTENLFDNDFDLGTDESYKNINVDSTADYIIQGPNNEVYMEGNATNSAVVFYVKETDSDVHELQIAVRALDYGRYYGAGSTALNAQLQYGILTSSGYAWKNLVRVVSGTEQYYSIPYAECPVDSQGRYQIVIRAVNPQTQAKAMVSYTNLKLNGLSLEKMEGLGEGTVVYYQNGILVKPEYELVIIDSSFQDVEVIPFTGNKLSLTLEQDLTYVYIRQTFEGVVSNYYAQSDPGAATSATMYKYDGVFSRFSLDIPKGDGDVTLTIKQTSLDSLEVSYCLHTFGEGVVTREPNCSVTGITAYTCTECDHIKQEIIPTNDDHTYSGAVCVLCGKAEDKYYLIGHINGKDYGYGDDYLNMGEYLFVDGKLKVTFEKDSYVFVKADNNAAWYMAQTYVTDSTGTLYDTATGAAEKMYVPCNLELTFTLVVNEDGSLTLSYTLPCSHEWGDGETTLAPSCTETGIRTYTCSKCYETKTEDIPATGHTYVDGICKCGDVEMRTVYFRNTAGWESVYIWAWADNGTNYTGGVWPGAAMIPVEGEENLYSYELPTFVSNILITNNGSETDRTGDLVIPTDGREVYDYSIGDWTTISGEPEYYLVGFINGANHGCDSDSANMGSYKFVDGKLVATFTADSYVFIKTTANANWYMTQAYCDTYAATLYNTTTGAGEKMFVPGGVELTFTLVDNGDDTFDLTVHSWGSVVTKTANCTEAGEITYTCNLCNDTYKETVPALGHSFDSTGTCTVCGVDDTRTIYFKNTAGWEKVYLWAWVEGGENYTGGEWPGVEMTLVDGETDLYSYTISVKARSAIFSNENGTQTDNQTIPTDGRTKFTYIANVWTDVDEDVEVDIPEAQTLYLLPNANWNIDDARFAAYFYNDSGNVWVDMTDADGDGYYECVVPEGYSTVIFCRMNPATTENNWDNKWNQTGNLAVPTDETNLCTINDGEWDCGENVTWSVYTPPACEHSYESAVTTAATCTEAGEMTYTCSKCSDSYTEAIEATGHSYESVVTKAVTCTEDGETTYTCANCSDSYTETVTATGHNYVDGTCSNCGEAETVTESKTLYLLPNSNWTQGDARFAAYFYNDSGSTWVDMTDEDGNGYYECVVPDGYTTVIFCRMDPGNITNDWSAKWNQTGDLAVPTDETNLCTINDGEWDCGTNVTWSVYDPSVADCQHSYESAVTTAATCTETGVKTYTCSSCGTSYTETIVATGHTYVDGTCSVCGVAEPTEEQVLYLLPNSNWTQSDARFAAYFYNDSGNTWVDMTDADGDGYYECVVPNGYTYVIFCRMDPSNLTNDWSAKWNQTGDLSIPTDGTNLCTIPADQWDCGTSVTWSVYGTTVATLSMRMVRSMSAATVAESELLYVVGDEENALNLHSVNKQMSSDVVFGELDEIGDDETSTEVNVSINSAAPVLSDDINLRYYVTVPEDAENVYMTFNFNGKLTTVSSYVRGEDGRLCFTFRGINALTMGDSIDATLYATVDGEVYTDNVADYSIRKYCVNVLDRGCDEQLKTMISDLLVYGAKAQVYDGYKTDALVTDGLELTPSTYTELDESYNKLTVQGEADANVGYTGVTLVLSGKMTLRLTVTTADPSAYTYKVQVGGIERVYTAEDLVEAGDGKYYLYFSELKATAFDEVITASIEQGGQQIGQTVTYSVNTYVQRQQNTDNEALRELLEAIYNYGRSAENYTA